MLLCPAQGHTPVKVSSGSFKLRLNPGNVHLWPARIQTAALSASRGWLLRAFGHGLNGLVLSLRWVPAIDPQDYTLAGLLSFL
jgi:hypothetical protein